MDTFFRSDLVARYFDDIARATLVTIEVAACVIVTGVGLGLLLAIIRSYKIRAINFVIVAFSDICRSLPPLVLILLTYFGLPGLGIDLSNFSVLWIVLSLVLAAFAEEIFWSGILSVRRGQWEAARSTGLGYSPTLLFVVLPQAIRITVPPLTNRTIVIIKNTALGSVIGVPEILNVASTAESFVGNITPLTMGALAYLALFIPITVLGRWIEAQFSWTRA
ncbi:amino acid ABC transporter permease [Bradyrhizobium sp. AUGA SZCCT0182]|nr:amino acid ABC transporter permease [Bradyrhizobium sp. AUGA SZCCT0182]